MTASIRARVFVVGCPRSGTTLVQSIVGAHPSVRAFPESHFFARAAHAPREEALLHLRAFLDAAGIPPPPDHLAPVDAFVAALDAAALAEGADVWSEKTPRHLHHVELISGAVPDARFVHVLRSGTDTVTSLHRVTREAPERWGGRPRSLRRCARRWETDVRTSLGYMGAPVHHFVRYEALVARPDVVAAGLCRFLDVSFEPAMLEGRRRVAGAISLPAETWKARTAGPLAAPAPAPEPPGLAEALAETQALLDDAAPAGG